MTETKIIEALKCCIDSTDDVCLKCPMFDKCEDCETAIKKYALDLIIQMQDKINEHKNSVKRIEQEFRYWQEAKRKLAPTEKGGVADAD